jgi:ABC-2 type transport system permease protein
MMGVLESAYVVGRRDFVATVYSRTFLLFLLGPLLPIAFGFFFGNMGERMGRIDTHPTVAVVSSAAEFQAINAAHKRLGATFTEKTLPDLIHAEPDYVLDAQVKDLLAAKDKQVLAVLTGGLAQPKLTGSVSQTGRISKQMGLILDEVRQTQALQRAGASVAPVRIAVATVDESAGSLASARSLTAIMAQTILFVLTMVLATLLLSNMVEEKSNKVIEVLAAAVPVDAIFMGKLFAMLAISLVGITVWAVAGVIAAGIWMPDSMNFPEPAIGWPAFVVMAFIYFAANYLLLGALLLGIGSQASSIREIQTISMPVTMGQLVAFFIAFFAIGQHNNIIGWAAAIFPFSSPLAMLARAAQTPELWPHLLALFWQALWVWLIIRFSASLFRRNVMKSGGGGISARKSRA